MHLRLCLQGIQLVCLQQYQLDILPVGLHQPLLLNLLLCLHFNLLAYQQVTPRQDLVLNPSQTQLPPQLRFLQVYLQQGRVVSHLVCHLLLPLLHLHLYQALYRVAAQVCIRLLYHRNRLPLDLPVVLLLSLRVNLLTNLLWFQVHLLLLFPGWL